MLHLPPQHHETSKHNSPKWNKGKRKTKRNYPGFEFKPRQVNDSSQSNKRIDHLVSQSPPWWVHWQQKHKVWSSNSRPYEAQLEDPKSQEKLKKVMQKVENSKSQQKVQKAAKPSKNGKEELRKAQKSKKSSNSRQMLKISTNA
jgi:hypothetical protein